MMMMMMMIKLFLPWHMLVLGNPRCVPFTLCACVCMCVYVYVCIHVDVRRCQ
jgi:hypothetical protein